MRIWARLDNHTVWGTCLVTLSFEIEVVYDTARRQNAEIQHLFRNDTILIITMNSTKLVWINQSLVIESLEYLNMYVIGRLLTTAFEVCQHYLLPTFTQLQYECVHPITLDTVLSKPLCGIFHPLASIELQIQWNLSVMTTSIMKFITCDLFSNVFLIKTECINFLLLTISVFWSSSRWPRQRFIPLGVRYRQVSLYRVLNLIRFDPQMVGFSLQTYGYTLAVII